MKKKLFAICMILVCLFMLCSCGKSAASPEDELAQLAVLHPSEYVILKDVVTCDDKTYSCWDYIYVTYIYSKEYPNLSAKSLVDIAYNDLQFHKVKHPAGNAVYDLEKDWKYVRLQAEGAELLVFAYDPENIDKITVLSPADSLGTYLDFTDFVHATLEAVHITENKS